MSEPSPEDIYEAIPLSRIERLICEKLARNFGRFVRGDSLVAFVYAEHPDGGPLTAETSISVIVHRLRKKLAGTGLAIEGHKAVGRRMVWAADRLEHAA